MIVESPYPDVLIPEVGFMDYMLNILSKYGDAIALVESSNSDKAFTFDQVKEFSMKCASAFTRLGITKGDVIGSCIHNCIEFPCLLLAVAACGAMITTCNPCYTEDEIVKQFLNSQPKIVFVNEANMMKMKAISKKISSIQHIITIEKTASNVSFQQLIEKANLKDFPKTSIDPKEDVLLLPYSSGTTGHPKGVMITHYNVIAYSEIFKVGLPCSRRDVVYISIPMFHITGCYFPVSTLTQGAKLVVEKKFSIKKFFKAVETHKVTYLSAVPPMVLDLYNCNNYSGYDLSSLASICSTAAPLPQVVAEEVKTRFNVHLFQEWGLTEGELTSGAIDLLVPAHSVGTVVPNTKIKVIDDSSGKSLKAFELGELCGKGPQIMKGYYNNPSATMHCIDKDGWFHTGDIGYFDEFGCFYIVDRLKELIKYKGFQIAPAELEEILLRHPCIADAAVIGVSDSVAGEVPKAFLVKTNSSLNEKEIQSFLRGKVANYKYLRGGVEFVDGIPKSPSGKILRRELRKQELKSKL